MGAVADLFDRNNEGLIDWQEFIAALRPDWQERKPAPNTDVIHDEVKRLVMLCTCRQKFRVFQVGEGKYRVSCFFFSSFCCFFFSNIFAEANSYRICLFFGFLRQFPMESVILLRQFHIESINLLWIAKLRQFHIE